MNRALHALSSIALLTALAGCGTHALPGASVRAASSAAVRSADGAYTLISQPEGTLRTAVLGAIDNAKTSLDVAIYQLSNHEVVDHLVKAVQRGVSVRVLYESDPYYLSHGTHRNVPRGKPAPMPSAAPGAPAGARAQLVMGADGDTDVVPPDAQAAVQGTPDYTSNALSIKDLVARCAGAPGKLAVQAAADSRFALTHEKAMVVDNQTALILTSNFSTAGLNANREYGVIDRDPAEVREVEAIFEADFTNGQYQPTQANLVVSPDDGSGQGNARTKIMNLMAGATKSIRIEDEELMDDGVAKLLGQKAAAGVTVQVLIDSGDRSKAAAYMNPYGLDPLGWAPPNLKVASKKATLHAKLIVVDDQVAYLGSVNLSTQSMGYNRELGILLTDGGIVHSLLEYLQADWASAMASKAPKKK